MSTDWTDPQRLAYTAVFRRAPDIVFHQTHEEAPRIDVYRFPPTRRFWAPARDVYVYATAGMSAEAQPNASGTPAEPSHVEMTAFVPRRQGATREGGQDPVARVLHDLAHAPFRRDLFLGPLHTVDMGQPLAPGSPMTGFFFAVTPGVDQDALCRAAGRADLFIQAVPVSTAEMHLAVTRGPEALLDLLDHGGVPPYFDLRRESLA